jgi:hypothetical protein
MRRAGGKIAAIGLLPPLWFFRRSDTDQKKMLGVPCGGEGFILLTVAVHLSGLAPYTQNNEFICNLNDMRS